MATTAGPTLSLAIDAAGAQRGARDFERAIDQIQASGRRAGGAIDDIGRSVQQLPPQLSKANAAIAGFVGGLAAQVGTQITGFLASLPGQVISVADAYQRLDARLAMVTGSMQAGARAHEDLYNMSQRLGVSFEATGGFFARLASQSKELGLSYEQLLTVTETLEGAFKLGGASAGETSAAMMQLGQAFASGKLQGDEFRSVAENAPVVLDLLSQALGVTRGELMEMAREGELTSQALAQGLLQIAPQVSDQVRTMGSTVSDETQRMMNAWSELLAEFAKTSGVTDAAKESIRAITAYLESDAGKRAVQEFAGAVGGLIQVFENLVAIGTPVADALNAILGSVQSAGEAIAKYTAGARSAIGELGKLADRQTGYVTGGGFGGESVDQVLRSLQNAEVPPAVGDKDFGLSSATAQINAWREMSAARAARLPAPSARPRAPGYKMQEIEVPKGAGRRRGRGGASETREIRFEIDAKPFEDEILRLDGLSDGLETDTQRRARETLDQITRAHLQASGDRVRIIELDRDAQLDALRREALSSEDAARARVMIEETASREIMEIRRQEAAQIEGLERENIQQRASSAFGDERKQYQLQLVRMERDARIAEIEASNMQEETRQRAVSIISDTAEQRMRDIDPTPIDAASRALLQFGEQMTSVEGMTQGMIQGIASIGATATSAFADAIVSGKDFGEVLDSLATSIQKMIIQLTMQMALQQALGAGATALGGMFAGGAGAGGGTTTGAEYGTFQTGVMLAKGGVVRSELPHGVYREPTYFEMKDPGFRQYAKGVGLMGEAGPEAVMPLTRTPSGRLGVEASSARPTVINNVYVNNSSRANVSSEERENDSGGTDITLTIADQVEGIVAGRMARSGTRVNRAVAGVGHVRAR